MKLSEHFDSKEFACKCGCGFDIVNPELIGVLEDLRTFFGSPVTINSGCRCTAHNRKIGGAPSSQHTLGTAADIAVKDVLPIKVYTYLNTQYPDKFGIGLYSSWVHIDVRKNKARW